MIAARNGYKKSPAATGFERKTQMNLLEERLANSENYVKAQMALLELTEEAMETKTQPQGGQMPDFFMLMVENARLHRVAIAARKLMSASTASASRDAYQELSNALWEVDHA
jgi:hypothetical protein